MSAQLSTPAVAAVSVPVEESNSKLHDDNMSDVNDVCDAFCWGLACGAASCMESSPSAFTFSEAEALYPGVKSEVLNEVL